MYEDNFLKKLQGSEEAKVLKAPAFGEALASIVKDDGSMSILNSNTFLPLYKAMGTVDIAPLRLVSIAEGLPRKAYEDTAFLSWLEAKGRPEVVNDYQIRIRERDVDNYVANKFNMDGALPADNETVYRQRYNTTTALGQVVMPSMMAQNIMAQQTGMSLVNQQLEDAFLRIRRSMNSALLVSTEVTAESSGNVPSLGGFINRTTLTTSGGGGNLTNTLIQTAVNDLGQAFGYEKQLVMFVHDTQVPVIDDLMINRYPGSNFETQMALVDRSLREAMAQAGVTPSTVYRPRPGRPIPVILETSLPAGTALIAIAEFPKLARFQFNGGVGPYALARPEATLYDRILCFDLFSLADFFADSRYTITSLL